MSRTNIVSENNKFTLKVNKTSQHRIVKQLKWLNIQKRMTVAILTTVV